MKRGSAIERIESQGEESLECVSLMDLVNTLGVLMRSMRVVMRDFFDSIMQQYVLMKIRL